MFLAEVNEVNFINVSLCENTAILGTIYFIKELLNMVWYIIPMGLIVMTTIDLAKSVVSSGSDEMQKNGKMVIKRIILCMALFLIPTIVNFAINMVSLVVTDSDFDTCYQKTKWDKIQKPES